MNIYNLIDRANLLQEETTIDSISPSRIGSLIKEILLYINEYQLLASSPEIQKIYFTVSAMQSDGKPVSDLTGRSLNPGQLVVIVPESQTDATAGDVYRYDGPSGNTSAWTFVAKIGAVPADSELNASSTNPVQNKVVTEKLTELSEETISNSLSPLEGYYGRIVPQGGGFVEIARFYINKGYKYRLYVKTERPTPSGGYYVTGIYDENGSTIAEVGMLAQTEATSFVFEATERRLVVLKSELTIPFDWNVEIVEIAKLEKTKDFIVDAIIEGWDKPESKLYIDYIYRNDASYGSGIRIRESNGTEFLYKVFDGQQNGIAVIKENVGKYHLQLTINWDAIQDGFNAILEKPLYFPESAYFPLNSLDNKVQEIYSYLPYHFEKQSSMLYDDLHDEIGIKLKKGAKIINNGVELMIATNTSIADYVTIPLGGVYFLDSDKEFLCSVPIGLVDFDYYPFASSAELEELKSQISEPISDKVGLSLPNKVIAVAGDTLQLFYRSICDCAKADAYDFSAVCDYGKSFPRYWEYTPTSADVGKSFPLTINVRQKNNSVIATMQTLVQVVSAIASASSKRILCVGDSTSVNGVWVGELKRRLTETSGNGTPSNPNGLGLSNISFVGRKQGASVPVALEATGGWKVSNYGSKGERAIRFIVSGVNTLSVGANYTIGSNLFVVQEVNVTNGVGNIRCTLNSSYVAPSNSGTLTKVSGNGDDAITYSSYSEETFSPFWNDTTNKLDFKQYADKFCGGSIDVLIWHCGVNDIFAGTKESINTTIESYKAILSQYNADFPNGKVIISSVPVGSLNGGFASNYGASANANGMVFMAQTQSFAKALQDLCDEYSYAFYAPVMEEFDAENGYPIKSVAVNNRASVMEDIGTNALHPTDEGSLMVADAIYRTINAMTL